MRNKEFWKWVGFCSIIFPWFVLSGCGVISAPSQPEGLIVFTILEGGDKEIYILDLAAEQEIRVDDDAYNEYYVDLSPDGSKLIFTAEKNGSSEIYIMNIDGSDLEKLTSTGNDLDSPAWSPDGEWIAYKQEKVHRAIYRFHLDNISSPFVFIDVRGASSIVWSPDGKEVAFSTKTYIIRDVKDAWNYEIFIANIDEGYLKQVTTNTAGDWVTSWSPDGRYLLFISNREMAWDETRVYVLEIETGEVWPLIQDDKISAGTSERNGIWSPDGEWVVLSIDRQMCIVNKEGELYKCYGEHYRPEDWGK